LPNSVIEDVGYVHLIPAGQFLATQSEEWFVGAVEAQDVNLWCRRRKSRSSIDAAPTQCAAVQKSAIGHIPRIAGLQGCFPSKSGHRIIFRPI
jgi:hypothetical protein